MGVSIRTSYFSSTKYFCFFRNSKIERHCIVLACSQPYQIPSQSSISYHGFYPEQLAEMMVKVMQSYPWCYSEYCQSVINTVCQICGKLNLLLKILFQNEIFWQLDNILQYFLQFLGWQLSLLHLTTPFLQPTRKFWPHLE